MMRRRCPSARGPTSATPSGGGLRPSRRQVAAAGQPADVRSEQRERGRWGGERAQARGGPLGVGERVDDSTVDQRVGEQREQRRERVLEVGAEPREELRRWRVDQRVAGRAELAGDLGGPDGLAAREVERRAPRSTRGAPMPGSPSRPAPRQSPPRPPGPRRGARSRPAAGTTCRRGSRRRARRRRRSSPGGRSRPASRGRRRSAPSGRRPTCSRRSPGPGPRPAAGAAHPPGSAPRWPGAPRRSRRGAAASGARSPRGAARCGCRGHSARADGDTAARSPPPPRRGRWRPPRRTAPRSALAPARTQAAPGRRGPPAPARGPRARSARRPARAAPCRRPRPRRSCNRRWGSSSCGGMAPP